MPPADRRARAAVGSGRAHRRRGRAVGDPARRLEPVAAQLRLAAADAAGLRPHGCRDGVRRRAEQPLYDRKRGKRTSSRAVVEEVRRNPVCRRREPRPADQRRRARALQRRRPPDSAAERALANLQIVSEDYFAMLRIPFVRGAPSLRGSDRRAWRLRDQRVAREAVVPRRVAARPGTHARARCEHRAHDRRRGGRREEQRHQRARA